MVEAAIDRIASGEAEGLAVRRRRRRGLGLRFWLPVFWIGLVAFGAATADFWPMPAPETIDFINRAAMPGTVGEIELSGETEFSEFRYLLGTDNLGRDILSRLVHGARVSLLIGLLSPLIGLLVGGALGVLAGYYRGRVEGAVVAAMDIILAFPALVLLLAITFYLGPSLLNLILALGFLSVPASARVARANTLSLAGREFVLAAKAMGASDLYILVREIVPNVLMPLLVFAMLLVAVLIVAEGTLSFLGLSVPPPTPSWGTMIEEGRELLDQAPHVTMIPAAAMCLTVLSFNLIGDRLRSLIDPRESRL
ncbi:MAG: ABC transporter permease [Alphaproteobacteria bacterium]|nr:ABC transporter permease [Alphaproteobacteria bacterium]MCW5742264.1 ABC transporter permease [Alphaproteobacteria bacterium]